MKWKCKGYWTDDCRVAGCEHCGTVRFDGLPEKGCTCASVTEANGYVYQTTLTRSETCAIHGRCRCGSSALKYDDHRECDYTDREWKPACPIAAHVQS